jgi:hypothetical protein
MKYVQIMTDFINFLEKTFPILLIIFIAVFLLLLAARLTLAILIHFAQSKYQAMSEAKKNRINNQEVPPIVPKYPKEDQELFIKKDDLKKNHSYEKLPSVQEQTPEIDEVQIVDIVKPVGKWTAAILGRELSYLVNSARIMNQKSNKGFWVSMIEAQQMAAGRQRSRGSR